MTKNYFIKRLRSDVDQFNNTLWEEFIATSTVPSRRIEIQRAAGWTERKHLYHITYYVDGNRKISTWGNSTKETIAQYLQWYNQNGFVWLNG